MPAALRHTASVLASAGLVWALHAPLLDPAPPGPATVAVAHGAAATTEANQPPAGLSRDAWSQVLHAVRESGYHAGPVAMTQAARLPVTVDPNFVHEAELFPHGDSGEDSAFFDNFGFSVSVSGDTVVVGAPQDDTPGGQDAGSAYVFVRSGSTWIEQQKLLAPDGAGIDRFGQTVSVSGDTLVVGAYLDQTPGGFHAGSAYVFVRSGTTWSLQQKLLASDGAAEDRFGSSVSVSGDTVLVGAPGVHFSFGAAYVFVRAGTTWTQQQRLSVGLGDAELGRSVAVSGNTLVVGAYLAGAACVFVRSGITWTLQQVLYAPTIPPNTYFGWSVAVSGNTVVVGEVQTQGPGAAYVFVDSGAGWTLQQQLVASDGAAADYFGWSVSVSGDTVVVGAYLDDTPVGGNAGSAYVFVRSGTTWTEQPKLVAPDGTSDDSFGYSVSVSGDTVVVGAYTDDIPGPDGDDAGSAHVFRQSLADLSVTKTDGSAIAIPGGWVTYTINVANAGPSAVGAAPVNDTLPAALSSATWTCSASPGSTCSARGSGGIDDSVNLLGAGTATYTLTATVDPLATGTLSNTATVAVPGGVTDPNPSNDSASDTDVLLAGISIEGELVHGYQREHDLAALPGPATQENVFRIFQPRHASYEVVLDGASGDLGSGSGPLLDRLASDASTVLQGSDPAGAGGSRSLRWMNAADTPVADEFVRVRSAGCTTTCDAADVYQLRVAETTGFIPRFNNSGTQTTFLVLENTGDTPMDVEIRFWSGVGSALGGPPIQTLGPRQAYVLNTSSIVPGSSGSVTLGNTGAYGQLAGKAVAVEPVTGFTFDTALRPRPR